MRLFKCLAIAVVVVLFCAIATNVSFASKADELLNKADAYLKKAESAEKTIDEKENFEKALETYQKVAKDFDNTPQGVRALYGVATVHRASARGDEKKLRQAYDAYKQLVNRYDNGDEKLSKQFKPAEVRQIKALVSDAEKARVEMASELDEANSHKTLYKIMDFFVGLTGKKAAFSYWFAIILVTLIVKLAVTPLTKAQFKAMKEMQTIAPLVKDIQAKYKGDQKAIGEKTMELYKEHKINPFASCIPLIIQLPVLWLLYYMIRQYEFQFAQGEFLWIGKNFLAHLAGFNVPFFAGGKVWLTAANLAEPDLLLVVLYVISMFISTKLSAVDPTQAEQQKTMAIAMPLMFAFIFAGFPSAFLLYWLVYNVIQTVQQYLILHKGPQPQLATAPAGPAEPQELPEAAEEPKPKKRPKRKK